MPSDEEDTSAGPVAYGGDASAEEDRSPVESSDTDTPPSEERSDDTDPKSESEPEPEPESESESEPDEENDDEEEIDPASIDAVETILVDPEDVVEAAAYNGQEDIGRKGKAVFGLTPPFEGTVEPTIRHLDDDSTESKADDEVHLRPFRFVAEGRRVIEQRPTRRLAKEELDAEDPDETAIEGWLDEAMETWKDHVRENLVGSVDIYSAHGMAFVDVEYEKRQ
jgi:hypothetical protein